MRPVDDADGVVGFGIVWIEVDRFAVISLGVVELLHLQVQAGDDP